MNEEKNETVNFDEDSIKEYLDNCIKFWREKRDNQNSNWAKFYIDAYQSVRISLFGELLPE